MKLMAISIALLMCLSGALIFPAIHDEDEGSDASEVLISPMQKTDPVFTNTEIDFINIHLYDEVNEDTRYVAWSADWDEQLSVTTDEIVFAVEVKVLVGKEYVDTWEQAEDNTRVSFDLESPGGTNALSIGYNDWNYAGQLEASDYFGVFYGYNFKDNGVPEDWGELSGSHASIDNTGEWPVDVNYQLYTTV